jgi:hypothetical protein
MKKEAVNMRPTDTMTTASVGYHSTGTGLEIAFAACDTNPHGSAQRAPKQNPGSTQEKVVEGSPSREICCLCSLLVAAAMHRLRDL